MSSSKRVGIYECVFGDLMFGLGLPFAVRSEKSLKRLAAILMPVVSRLPFEWVYPTGEKQDEARAQMGEVLPVGHGDRRRLSLYQAPPAF